MFKKLLKTGNYDSKINFGLLIFRVGISSMMLSHGYPKFLNLISGDIQFPDPLELGVEVSFLLTVLAEFVCSILLILGLVTRYATIPLIITMAVALSVIHVNDPFAYQEKAFLYLLSYLFLLVTGPGKYSLDKHLFG